MATVKVMSTKHTTTVRTIRMHDVVEKEDERERIEFTIKRTDGMAQLIVRQGSEEWIVSSNTIEELPDETQRWAIQLQNLINGCYGLLHSMPTGFNVVVPQTFPNNQDANDPARVEELQQRIRELQQTIEDLQTQQP